MEIYQNQSPDGTLNPPLKVPDSEMRLDGFRWHPDLRPDRAGMGIDELLPPPPEGTPDRPEKIIKAKVPEEVIQ